MSLYKLAAGLVALALSAAVVTALAGATPEVKADLAPQAKADVVPEAKVNLAPAAAKSDRPAARSAKPDIHPLTSACPREPWPFGCQWRQPPARRVIRSSRPL
jgi:hypothetical protein